MTTIPNLASLRLGGRNMRIRDSSITGTFAQPARYDKHVGVSFRIAVRRARSREENSFLRVFHDLRGGRSHSLLSIVAHLPWRKHYDLRRRRQGDFAERHDMLVEVFMRIAFDEHVEQVGALPIMHRDGDLGF